MRHHMILCILEVTLVHGQPYCNPCMPRVEFLPDNTLMKLHQVRCAPDQLDSGAWQTRDRQSRSA
jgi:hypothetical protein